MLLDSNGVVAGVPAPNPKEIRKMTTSEWKAWCESTDYDPDQLIAVTDDFQWLFYFKDGEISTDAGWTSYKINQELTGLEEEMTGLKDNVRYKTYNIESTLLAENWTGEDAPYIYDFSSTYPTNSYDIDVITDIDSLTSEQLEAIMELQAFGGKENKLYAFGTKPLINLPIVLKVTPLTLDALNSIVEEINGTNT